MTSEIQDIYFLTPLQQGMLYHSLRAQGSSYVQQLCYELEGPVDVGKLREAWTLVLNRHAALRTVFIWERKDEPLQAVLRNVNLNWEEGDWQFEPAVQQEEKWQQLLLSDRNRGFDLASPPLLRLFLLRLGQRRYRLVWIYHHLILDGWSTAIVLREVAAIYAGLVQCVSPSLVDPRPFRDYVAWLRQQNQAEALEFWQKRMHGYEPQTLVAGMRQLAEGIAGGPPRTESLMLSANETRDLETFAHGREITTYTVLLGAWALLLSRLSGVNDLVIGAVIGGRPAELDGAGSMVGMSINTVPLRMRVQHGESQRPWLRKIQQDFVECCKYGYCPLADIQKESAVPAGSPLFETLFVFENYPVASMAGIPGVRMSLIEAFEQTDYPLTVEIEWREKGRIEFIYDPAKVGHGTVSRLLKQYVALLKGFLNQETCLGAYPIGGINMEGPPLASQFVATCVHEIFAEQAKRTPVSIALRHAGTAVSYGDLHRRAVQISHSLHRLGVRPEARIGLCIERSSLLVEAMLGTLGAGAAYVPLDPAWPEERLRMVIKSTGISMIVHSASFSHLALETGASHYYVEALRTGNPENLAWPDSGVESQNLAYIICTSGSTGTPKAVGIEHHNTAAFLQWALETFSHEELSCVAAGSSIMFDLSIFEIFAPLISGGAVLIIEDVLHLLEDPDASHVTLINSVPSAVSEALNRGGVPPSVLTVNLAGEALSNALVQSLYTTSSVLRVLNLYGPTEDTTYSTMYEAPRNSLREPLIGSCLSLKSACVLDSAFHALSEGNHGELYLGGAGVARGYLNRPATTAERFIPDMRPGHFGERLYRTGDHVFILPGGELQYLGRKDHQIKHRGVRIELGEIESILRSHPAIGQAAAVLQSTSVGDRLVAFVTLLVGQQAAPEQLRSYVALKTTHFCVPSAIYVLESLPLTRNGKLDRKALEKWRAEPEYESTLPDANFVRATVRAVWAQVLDQPLQDNASFFEQGGHSLLAAQLVSRLRMAFGMEFSLREIFENPTMASISDRIEDQLRFRRGLQATGTLRPNQGQTQTPCSFAQQRLWFMERLHPERAVYHVVPAFRLQGQLNVHALDHALEEFSRRHSALRTTIVAGPPLQQWVHEDLLLRLEVAEATEEDIHARAREIASCPFDLEAGPLARACLFRLGPDDHVLVIVLHHIICDRWSISILARELPHFYKAKLESLPALLPRLPMQYTDFALWERELLSGPVLQQHAEYWRRRLRPPLPQPPRLPGLREPGEKLSGQGARNFVQLPLALSNNVRQFATQNGLTTFVVFASTLQLLLHFYTGDQDVLIGADISTRSRIEFESTFGLFVNQIVLRANLAKNPTFLELAKQCREQLLDDFLYLQYPFEKIKDEISRERSAPLFPVKLVMQNTPQPEISTPGLTIRSIPITTSSAGLAWTLIVEDSPEGLQLISEYSTDAFEEGSNLRILRRLETLLSNAIITPMRPISALSWLSDCEQDGAGPQNFPDAGLSHLEFERICDALS